MPGRRLVAHLLAVVLATGSQCASADEIPVAVAANFAVPMQQIAQAFERASGHRVRIALGSTGRFHAQIRSGAPFQLLLAADQETPARLEREGLAVPGTRFTYAVGRLVLWSATPGLVDAQGEVLRTGRFERLAIADPRLAPYGAAAWDSLQHLGLLEALKPRLVQGESVAQAFAFVASGNATLGFVALSQLRGGAVPSGSAWLVPAQLHRPLRQDAVVLAAGKGRPAALALARFLQAQSARDIIHAYGYEP